MVFRPNRPIRGTTLTVLLTKEERKAVARAAAGADRSASEWARLLILKELEKLGEHESDAARN